MKLSKEQTQALKCAYADLVGAKQAFDENDIHVHDWEAHEQSIIDMEHAFPGIIRARGNLGETYE